ncbi:hypothetical protein REC_124 [Pseudomonas phage REC]|nr:hypothetical protein REC_124 [Pseudomonas phage REC]UGL62699.1 hypothetical protein [Pseudomonas phage REC1]
MKPEDLLPPTMNGNIIMLNFMHRHSAIDFALSSGMEQFSMSKIENGSFMLSLPVSESFEDKYRGMVHGAKARARDKEKPDPKPPTGGGDGTPPSGGTPGTPVLDRYTYTEARAA